MKKFFTFLVLFLFQFSYSQVNKEFKIDWKDGGFFVSEKSSIDIPHFNSDCFVYDDLKKTILYSNRFEVSSEIDEKNIAITNMVYEAVAESSLGILNKSYISSSHNISVQNSIARDLIYGVLTLSPIIKEGNSYKRIKSFTYTYTNGSSMNRISNRNVNTVSSSVMKTGIWKRFYIQKSGVYKISKAFLVSLGFDVNVNPKNIKIYGNGGRMLPLLNSESYPIDIAENAIYFNGEEDGMFNDFDYILFYAEGMDNWSAENQTHLNLYSDKSYYYVTSSGASGKRITPISESQNPINKTFTTFDNYAFHEIDKVNILKLGRRWFGEDFDVDNEQTFQFQIPNIVTTIPVQVRIQSAATVSNNTSFSVKANNLDIGNINLNYSPGAEAVESLLNTTFTVANSNIGISLNYNNAGVPSNNAFLDYITLKAKSDLKGFGKQFRFTVNEVASSIGTCEYQISSASAIGQVWDITDIYNVKSKINANQSSITLKAQMGENRNYIAVDNFDFYYPLKDSNSLVFNQDVKGVIFQNAQGVFQDVDYLIVTPYSLRTQAEKLANFHRVKSNLNVKVVVIEALYQEFSSGKQDIGAVRNFVKYVYDNASDPAKRVKYLCLFGDASYDFKDRIPNNTNIVPIFHALNSFSLSGSFISDDYFVSMNANEGNMIGSPGLDLAVGRILASNSFQAEQLVNKIIEYHDQKSYGKWRNNLVLISDDIDKSSDKTIQTDLNFLADKIALEKPFFNVKKIHADSYVQETTSGGQKYPKARTDFVNSFDQGTLVVDYFGHGGEDGLAGERIFERLDAINLNNKYKYPLFVTVTCEFTRFDNPYRPTSGEAVYWNPSGGAVSMVTTTRQIGQSTGAGFNLNLASKLFSYGSNNYPSIAEAVRLTKNSSANSGNNVVFYIGDPALKLAIPKPKIRLTKINDVPIALIVNPISALSYAKLTGEVVDEFDAVLTAYNGELAVNIFDKQVNRSTLGNDGYAEGGILQIMPFTTLGETIFRGNASVKNGLFEFGFVVSRDIKIPVGNGKVSFYAKNNAVPEDQTGYDFNIKIGGINTNAVADNLAPRVRLYMNDEAFVSGGITNESPLFLAILEDENGINTASGIGHDIIAYLDGDETKPYVLNDFYETELDDYTKGKLKYPFRNLAVGLHTLTFKAWDVYNNLITSELQFIVVGDQTLTLTNVLNYPNPFVNHTEFWFTHNKPFEPLDVQVQVLTITGKVVWTKSQLVTNDGFTSRDLTWDGRDDFGDKIGKGVYVYKLTVRSTITNKKTEKFEKLVIL
ncbi:type IX secretion system sortase PorU [Flavobacterium sp.]|uniref:type IX secretion system sortase PorU n=1 Tax=Flavobacterium sp. TaxID=239 RepID=UPI00286DB521|nr:type IX secretion system sortase PorU [Flavobacterium sp.]